VADQTGTHRVTVSIILTLTVEMSSMSRGIRAALCREDGFMTGRARWRTREDNEGMILIVNKHADSSRVKLESLLFCRLVP